MVHIPFNRCLVGDSDIQRDTKTHIRDMVRGLGLNLGLL
jgi:hypothetical protein